MWSIWIHWDWHITDYIWFPLFLSSFHSFFSHTHSFRLHDGPCMSALNYHIPNGIRWFSLETFNNYLNVTCLFLQLTLPPSLPVDRIQIYSQWILFAWLLYVLSLHNVKCAEIFWVVWVGWDRDYDDNNYTLITVIVTQSNWPFKKYSLGSYTIRSNLKFSGL